MARRAVTTVIARRTTSISPLKMQILTGAALTMAGGTVVALAERGLRAGATDG